MIVPSLVGLTPRSESRIAFSIAGSAVLSYGVMMSIRASGTWNDASWFTGVGAP